MRTTIAKVAFVAVFIIASVSLAVPARADGGSPFQPGDNRINPLTGDRVAVYCNTASVDVLGLDTENNGTYLTTFSAAELTSSKPVTHTTANGKVTLTLDQAAQTHTGFMTFDQTVPSLIVDQGAMYHVTWMGGPDNADGSQPFVKSFSCTY